MTGTAVGCWAAAGPWLFGRTATAAPVVAAAVAVLQEASLRIDCPAVAVAAAAAAGCQHRDLHRKDCLRLPVAVSAAAGPDHRHRRRGFLLASVFDQMKSQTALLTAVVVAVVVAVAVAVALIHLHQTNFRSASARYSSQRAPQTAEAGMSHCCHQRDYLL